MPVIVKKKNFVVTKDFDTTLESTADEFRENGNSNGLPIEAIIKREFLVTEDHLATLGGVNTPLKAKTKLRDVHMAHTLISRPGAPINIRDDVHLTEGMPLPSELGEFLFSNGFPVEEVEESEPEEGPESDAAKAEKTAKATGAAGDPPSAAKAAAKAEKTAKAAKE